MDNNNGSPPQGGEPSMEADDWRSKLPADLRQRTIDKIMDTLKKHLPFSGREGMNELKKIAVRFEEKIFAAATSQSDYLRKISLKMLAMETKSGNTMANSLQSNSAGNSNRPSDPVSSGVQPQVPDQGQSLSMPLPANQSQTSEQLLSQNIHNNILPAGVQSSAALSSELPPASSLNMPSLSSALPPTLPLNWSAQPLASGPTMPGLSSALPPASSLPMSGLSSALPPSLVPHVFTNSQRYTRGWQQQQSLKSPQYRYQQQLQQLIRMQQQQQQQQILVQTHQLQSSQQSLVQSAPVMQPSVLQSSLSRLQQNQQSAIPHSTQSMLQQPAMPQQNILPPQHQQQQLTASLDSTTQTGHTNGADWQEEVYQKIKVMKEMYLPELSEMYQKVATKLQQHESLPQQPTSDLLERLKVFKTMLERLMTVLQVSKSNISPGLKEKLGLYEKQVMNFININRHRNPDSSLQHMHSMQQSQSQVTQVQSHENQMNPQLQSMNLQGSVATMQQNNVTCLQQNPMSSLSGVSTLQNNTMNLLQPSSNMVPGQGNTLNSLQQDPVGYIQQTPLSDPQQVNMNALSSQSGINMLQANINPLQSNSGILQNQHLKQQEEQRIKQIMHEQLNKQRQLHDQLNQQRKLHEQLNQQRQLHEQLNQQRQLHEHQITQQLQRLQLQKEAKQQLPEQLQTHQMPEFHLINVVNDGNRNALSSQSGMKALQSNSGIVHDHNLKQQEPKMFQNQLKQSYQQLQMQEPQLLQEKHQQQIQQLQQQARQQLHHIYFIYLIFLAILLGAAFFGIGY